MATNKELLAQAVTAIPLWRAFLDQKEAEQDALLGQVRNEQPAESKPKELLKALRTKFRRTEQESQISISDKEAQEAKNKNTPTRQSEPTLTRTAEESSPPQTDKESAPSQTNTANENVAPEQIKSENEEAGHDLPVTNEKEQESDSENYKFDELF